jgi:hypothetical protein
MASTRVQVQKAAIVPMPYNAAVRACHCIPGGADRQQLAGLDTQVEGQQGHPEVVLGQADFLQGAGKAQAMDQPEQEGHQRRPAARQGVALAQCFTGHQHDRQRNAGLHRRWAQGQQAQRTAGQRQAVRGGEGGDGEHQMPTKAHQEQQADHEQQVVDSAEDVFHTQHGIGPGQLAAAALIVG